MHIKWPQIHVLVFFMLCRVASQIQRRLWKHSSDPHTYDIWLRASHGAAFIITRSLKVEASAKFLAGWAFSVKMVMLIGVKRTSRRYTL